jgi:hypothetical protein
METRGQGAPWQMPRVKGEPGVAKQALVASPGQAQAAPASSAAATLGSRMLQYHDVLPALFQSQNGAV